MMHRLVLSMGFALALLALLTACGDGSDHEAQYCCHLTVRSEPEAGFCVDLRATYEEALYDCQTGIPSVCKGCYIGELAEGACVAGPRCEPATD